MYYHVLVPNKVTQDPVVYKSSATIEPFSLVKVPFGKKELYGFVIERVGEKDITYDIEKILDIICIYSIQLPTPSRQFIMMCDKTTFLTPLQLVEQYIHSISQTLGKRKLAQFEIEKDNNKTINTEFKTQNPRSLLGKNRINYYLDINIVLRIIYLIRSHTKYISENNKTQSSKRDIRILIFYPEIKHLLKSKQQFEKQIVEEFKNMNVDFTINQYTNEKNKQSKSTVEYVLSENSVKDSNINTSYNIDIVFTTKLGMFLPFQSIDHIIVINESSSFYIQEQNSLYYDLRELIYLYSTSYNAQISFISTLPSLRLHNFNSKALSYENGTNILKDAQKGLKMQIYDMNSSQEDENALFSFQTLGLLCDLDD